MIDSAAISDEVFRDFFYEIPPIRMREPLAETLGAFKEKNPMVRHFQADFKATKPGRFEGHYFKSY